MFTTAADVVILFRCCAITIFVPSEKNINLFLSFIYCELQNNISVLMPLQTHFRPTSI